MEQRWGIVLCAWILHLSRCPRASDSPPRALGTKRAPPPLSSMDRWSGLFSGCQVQMLLKVTCGVPICRAWPDPPALLGLDCWVVHGLARAVRPMSIPPSHSQTLLSAVHTRVESCILFFPTSSLPQHHCIGLPFHPKGFSQFDPRPLFCAIQSFPFKNALAACSAVHSFLSTLCSATSPSLDVLSDVLILPVTRWSG